MSAAERAAVEARVPQRAPFLFLDRIVELGSQTLVAEWRVPEDADWFRGHFPGEPVTPGVLLCEHVFQAGTALVSELFGAVALEGGVPVLAKIERARFRRIVRPGERLSTRVELVERAGPAFQLSGTVRCGDERVLDVSFVLMRASAPTQGSV